LICLWPKKLFLVFSKYITLSVVFVFYITAVILYKRSLNRGKRKYLQGQIKMTDSSLNKIDISSIIIIRNKIEIKLYPLHNYINNQNVNLSGF